MEKTGTYGEFMRLRYTIADWILLAVEDVAFCAIFAGLLIVGFVLLRETLIGLGWWREDKRGLKLAMALSFALAQVYVAYVFVTELLPEDGFSLEPDSAVRKR